MNYEVKLGIDGFWNLYIDGTAVYDIHDDNVPAGLSREEVKRFVADSYEALDY